MASKVPNWVKKEIRHVVREGYRDSDGFWLYLFDEYEVDNASTVSGDTAAEAHEYFWSGSHNAALREALKKPAKPAKAKPHNIYLLPPRVKPTGLTASPEIPDVGGLDNAGNPL